jgi:hypothetical protein
MNKSNIPQQTNTGKQDAICINTASCKACRDYVERTHIRTILRGIFGKVEAQNER